MPKYLIEVCCASHGSEVEAGLLRRAAAARTAEELGGKLEAFYFAFDEVDVFCLFDLPDEASAVAVSMTINQSGAAEARIVPLIAPETFEAAMKKLPAYRIDGRSS